LEVDQLQKEIGQEQRAQIGESKPELKSSKDSLVDKLSDK
jgi:hypothetical protein